MNFVTFFLVYIGTGLLLGGIGLLLSNPRQIRDALEEAEGAGFQEWQLITALILAFMFVWPVMLWKALKKRGII